MQVQFIVRKELASVHDYQTHFFSLYQDVPVGRELLAEQYVSNLTDLVTMGSFQIVKYYVVISTMLTGKSASRITVASKQLFDIKTRLHGALFPANISLRALEQQELLIFVKKQVKGFI